MRTLGVVIGDPPAKASPQLRAGLEGVADQLRVGAGAAQRGGLGGAAQAVQALAVGGRQEAAVEILVDVDGLEAAYARGERIAKLLRFASTSTDTVSVGFADYKARMKEGQEAIYYITADSLAAAKNSPQLEVFKKKGIEVLLMTDRVDEWALSYLHDFDGTPLQSVAKGAVDLGKLQDEEEKKAAEAAAETFKPVLDKLKESLKDKAKDVRVTTRLVDSPACLVAEEGDMSGHLARLLKQAGQSAPASQPVLEVNADHALVRKLADIPEGEGRFDDLAQVLFDNALLAEGGHLEDPAAHVRRIQALILG